MEPTEHSPKGKGNGAGRAGKGASISPSLAKPRKIRIDRVYTRKGVHPFDEITWEKRTAAITSDKGEVIFEQKDVEVPSSWSQMATNVVVQKYFHGQQ
ncbi:MAG: hypothetical protein D6812_09675, partial [Deltaproteobacteria bacterium]